MGLRELKAERTRSAIAAAALDLFEEQGYEATTMEQIAAAAEVAPTTLYRYFPTKDSTLVAQVLPDADSFASHLRARPSDESLDVALGRVIHDRLTEFDHRAPEILRLRRQIDLVPTARARVWDSFYQEVSMLEDAIAERTGEEPSTISVQLTAELVVLVCQMALDRMRSMPDTSGALAYAAEALRILERGGVTLPKLPSTAR